MRVNFSRRRHIGIDNANTKCIEAWEADQNHVAENDMQFRFSMSVMSKGRLFVPL